MRVFVRHLLMHFEFASILWIHDGVWVYPDPPSSLVQQAEHIAVAETGLHVSLVRKVLLPKHDQYMQNIRSLPVTGPFEPKHHVTLRHLARLEWWQHVHESPGVLPTPVLRQIRHIAQVTQVDPAHSLHKFFARTAKRSA